MADPRVLPLTQDVYAPRAARDFIARCLTGVDVEVCANAALMASELVTNVVRHGELPAHVTVDVSDGGVRISVYDSSAALPPRVPTLPARGAGGGRGLLIVDALARSWGIHVDDVHPGKAVWFDLGLTDASSARAQA